MVQVLWGMSNATANAAPFTHTSYKAAIADVKRRKAAAGVARWDAGNGFVAEAYWCEWRKRVVQTTITPAGMRIV